MYRTPSFFALALAAASLAAVPPAAAQGLLMPATPEKGISLEAPLTTADGFSFADLVAFIADPHRAEASQPGSPATLS